MFRTKFVVHLRFHSQSLLGNIECIVDLTSIAKIGLAAKSRNTLANDAFCFSATNLETSVVHGLAQNDFELLIGIIFEIKCTFDLHATSETRVCILQHREHFLPVTGH